MVDKTDDLGREEGLPLPGTEEPSNGDGQKRADPTEGPGNVSVDEPTETSLSE